jgi:hypothetical protein
LAKNRKVILKTEAGIDREIRLEDLVKHLSSSDFEEVTLKLEKSKTVWVTTFTARLSRLEGERNFAIVMKASSWEPASDIDYFITNVDSSQGNCSITTGGGRSRSVDHKVTNQCGFQLTRSSY